MPLGGVGLPPVSMSGRPGKGEHWAKGSPRARITARRKGQETVWKATSRVHPLPLSPHLGIRISRWQYPCFVPFLTPTAPMAAAFTLSGSVLLPRLSHCCSWATGSDPRSAHALALAVAVVVSRSRAAALWAILLRGRSGQTKAQLASQPWPTPYLWANTSFRPTIQTCPNSPYIQMLF